MSTIVLILIYSKEIAMIINRNSELEKNMYAKLSQVDELISSNDVYALGLRLNALSSLCKALREDSAVKALTEALDKVIESGIIDSIDKNSLKHFMIGNAFYTASDFTGDDKYKNEAVKLAAGFKNLQEMKQVILKMQMIRNAYVRHIHMNHFIWHMKQRTAEKSSIMMLLDSITL